MDQNHSENDLRRLSDAELVALVEESDEKMARMVEDTLHVILKTGTIQPRNLSESTRDTLETRIRLRDILAAKREYRCS